jgi:hypothetical protein
MSMLPHHITKTKMVWLRDIGKQWFPWLLIGLHLLSYHLLIGFMLPTALPKFAINFQ